MAVNKYVTISKESILSPISQHSTSIYMCGDGVAIFSITVEITTYVGHLPYVHNTFAKGMSNPGQMYTANCTLQYGGWEHIV